MDKIKQELSEELTKEVSDLLGTTEWTLTKNNEGGKYGPGTNFELYKIVPGWVSSYIGTFDMIQFPGCCGICIAYFSRVSGKLQNLITKIQMYIAKQWGYSILMYAHTANQTQQGLALAENGWKDILTFINSSSRNTIHCSTVNL